jgi:hypothetical protein
MLLAGVWVKRIRIGSGLLLVATTSAGLPVPPTCPLVKRHLHGYGTSGDPVHTAAL